MSKTRVYLVDDHEIVRLGLMTLINDQPDLEVVGESGSAAEALAGIIRARPDVVLMDIRLRGEGGIELTQNVLARCPQTKVIILTSFANDDLVLRAITAGAVGYVLKQVGNDELLRAVRSAAAGAASLDPATTARLLNYVRIAEHKVDQNAFRQLSEREMDVLLELARGRTNAEIGRVLNLSEKTARNYVSNILEKLGLNNRIELAAYAVEHHIFDQVRCE
ncbi:MAG: DNA-binding response regulator [Chloroflexi bacterium RBG_16_57_11]|nr:MAG: DNA-binding response regulator [Chloroflexi bacterium RBG_16_57_11]